MMPPALRHSIRRQKNMGTKILPLDMILSQFSPPPRLTYHFLKISLINILVAESGGSGQSLPKPPANGHDPEPVISTFHPSALQLSSPYFFRSKCPLPKFCICSLLAHSAIISSAHSLSLQQQANCMAQTTMCVSLFINQHLCTTHALVLINKW